MNYGPSGHCKPKAWCAGYGCICAGNIVFSGERSTTTDGYRGIDPDIVVDLFEFVKSRIV